MSSPHGNERRPCTAPAPSPLPESKRGVQSWHLNFSPLVTVNKDVVDSRSPGGDEAEPKTSKNGTIEGSDKSRLDTNKSVRHTNQGTGDPWHRMCSNQTAAHLEEENGVSQSNVCCRAAARTAAFLHSIIHTDSVQKYASIAYYRPIRFECLNVLLASLAYVAFWTCRMHPILETKL